MTTIETAQARTQLDTWHQDTRLQFANWVIFDSVTTLNGRDTSRTVRTVHATFRAADSVASSSTVLLSDTAAAVSQIEETQPLAEKSKKSGVASSIALSIVADVIIFFILMVFFAVLTKKIISLRSQ